MDRDKKIAEALTSDLEAAGLIAEYSPEKIKEAAQELNQLYDVLYKQFCEEEKRKYKLKVHPNGYVIDGSWTCKICRSYIDVGKVRYDASGVTCPLCKVALQNNIIPQMVMNEPDAWYCSYDLERIFGIRHATMRSLVKKNILQARVILDIDKPHYYVFLIDENSSFLPPKKYMESTVEWYKKDGNLHSKHTPWYVDKDPKEYLKNFGILEYCRYTNKEGN